MLCFGCERDISSNNGEHSAFAALSSDAISCALTQFNPPTFLPPWLFSPGSFSAPAVLPAPSMWLSWRKRTVHVHEPSSPSSPYSCSTFKDVLDLCSDHVPPPTSRKLSIFHRVRPCSANSDDPPAQPSQQAESESPTVSDSVSTPDTDKRLVLYFTTLRVVRPTFQDCKTVRSILRGMRVGMEERDLSMDSRFLTELQQKLGQTELTLPRVFIGKTYIGGAEEIKRLHESGELKKLVESLPAAEPGECELCGGHSFIVCNECNGSHKLYADKTGFKSCSACNENGLASCPSCSSPGLPSSDVVTPALQPECSQL